MSSEFDFKAALHGLVAPSYERLNPVFREFYQYVAENGGDWSQNRQELHLIDGRPENIFDRFAGVSLREIAVASCTLYYWGHYAHSGKAILHYPGLPDREFEDDDSGKYTNYAHWQAKAYAQTLDQYPGGESGTWKIEMVRYGANDKVGATWKCSHLLDELLTERFREVRPSLKLGVIREGIWHTHNNDHVSFADEQLLTWCRENRDANPSYEFMFPEDAELKRWSSMAETYVLVKKPYSSEDLKILARPLVAGVFKIHDVRGVNYRVRGLSDKEGHPFCIGPRHLEAAQRWGGSLDQHALREAPCAYRGCGQDYDAHTSETALVLECLKQVSNKEAAAVLSAIKDKNEQEWKVPLDGFAFVKSEQGFTIDPLPFEE